MRTGRGSEAMWMFAKKKTINKYLLILAVLVADNKIIIIYGYFLILSLIFSLLFVLIMLGHRHCLK